MDIIKGIVPKKVDYVITLKNIKKIKGKFFSIKEDVYNNLDNEQLDFLLSKKGKLWIVPKNPKYILVISTRTEQILLLEKMFTDINIFCDTLFGKKNFYDPRAQVLVAGFLKAGVGFNDPKFKYAIYASDITDIRQAFGRLRRNDGIHYDIVDDHKNFFNHYKKRRKYYKSVGAKIIEPTKLTSIDQDKKLGFRPL